MLATRRGESLLLTLGIPLGLLVFFSTVDVLPLPAGVDEPVDFLAPGLLALAILSTGMVQTAIGVAFERQYGVLKRLGVTPLGRPRLLGAKLDRRARDRGRAGRWSSAPPPSPSAGTPPPRPGPPSSPSPSAPPPSAASGCSWPAASAGELTLAAANGLYLVLLLLGGMVFPLTELPGAAAGRSPSSCRRRRSRRCSARPPPA